MALKICLAVAGTAATIQPWDFLVAALTGLGVSVEVVDLAVQPVAALAGDLAARRQRGEPCRLVVWGAEDHALELRAFAELGQMVIVPAPDGPIRDDPAWWQQFQTHRFLAFSRALHERLLQSGLASAHFQYYAEPVPPAQWVDAVADRAALLWEPQGSTAASARTAIAQARAMGLRRVCVAASAPGDAQADLERLCAESGGLLELAPQAMGQASSGMAALLQRAVCLLAPQRAAGMDPALLQALARGRFVVAPDAPLLRDYIGNLASGLLYDDAAPGDLPWLDNGGLRALSAAAHARAVRGHARWQADGARLLSILADDGQRWSASDRSAAFGNSLRRGANAAARGEAVVNQLSRFT